MVVPCLHHIYQPYVHSIANLVEVMLSFSDCTALVQKNYLTLKMAVGLNKNDTRLFVSGLYEGINEKDIREHFEPFGTITDIFILRNKKKKSRGCCFVGFLNKLEASNALRLCNKTYLGTRRINVTLATTKQPKQTNKSPIRTASNLKPSTASKPTPKSREYQQFVRLSKSAANANSVSSDKLIDEFMEDSDDSNEEDTTDQDEANKVENKQQTISNCKVDEIFIRNLPFITTDEDLYEFFNEFGDISSVFIPIDDFGKSKGFGFVQFSSNEGVQALFTKYKERIVHTKGSESEPSICAIFNGRNVEICLSNYKYKETHFVNGQRICYSDLDDELKQSLSFKQLRDLKLKHNAKNDKQWNTFFIPTDNILRHNAKQLNTTKSELLGVSSMYEHGNKDNSMAITTTLAETAIISKTKKFLAESGIDVKKFSGSKKASARSRNIILVKNFPFNTTPNGLKSHFEKFGQISRFLMPETKSCAIIEFLNVKDAQSAFHNLAYSKFKHLPLFLEWAPINLFDEKFEKKKEEQKQEIIVKRGTKRKLNANEDGNDDKTKVIVKNIPFETQKSELLKLFGIYGRVKSLRLPRKYGGGHRGFCFIEFDTHKEAMNAFDAFSSSHFYGRRLVIEWAKNEQSDSKRTRIE